MEPKYKRVSAAKLGGTSKEASIVVSPSALSATFGPATEEPWDSESVGGYYFVSTEQRVFTLYFRAYDRSPEEIQNLRAAFWADSKPVEFSIGSHGKVGVAEFREWLRAQVAR